MAGGERLTAQDGALALHGNPLANKRARDALNDLAAGLVCFGVEILQAD
jgi:hypothetical protein